MNTSESIFQKLMDFNSDAVLNKSKNSDGIGVSKLKPSERLLQDIETKGFDMTQMKPILLVKGNQLIVSSAGSGKTTTIIFKIIYDLKTGRSTKIINANGNNLRIPEKIWVCTFLKSGADELKSAYRKWCNGLHVADMSQSIQFSTLHAEFKRALNAMGMKTNIIGDADNKKLLKKVLKTYNIRSSDGGSLNDDEYNSLLSALTCTRNMIDEGRYEAEIYKELNVSAPVVDCILRDWKNERIVKDMVDFEDLQEVLYQKCCVEKDDSIINFLANRFAYIYIDEFQDTSQIQYELLKIYCSRSKQVIAIGDDDQSIYSWRGSDSSIITERFGKDFSPTISNLSVNFRCPNVILDAIKPSIAQNKKRFEKVLKSNSMGGELRVGEYSSYRQMALSLCDMVYEDVKHNRSVCILCRVNSDGLIPALYFDKAGKFPFSISGVGMTLDSYIGRIAFSIVRLFTDKCSQSVRRALSLMTWNSYGINRLMEICKGNNISIWDVNEDDLKYSCPEISDNLLDWRRYRSTCGDITALKMVLRDYRCNVFTKDSQFNDVMRATLLSIESLIDYMNYDNVDDFLDELENMNNKLSARVGKRNTKVKIATVHEFKGKEADSIYIWNDSEDVFPYKRAINTDDGLSEERRIHYIACTRAKKISTIMYLKGKKGMFVGEMDLSKGKCLETETGANGSFSKEMKGKLEEESALQKFEQIVGVDENSEVI